MTLTTRLSLFFLAALALVLGGFSITLYLLARNYLYRQADDRLESALNTLVAAAETGPEGVEWEPHERHLDLGESVQWAVTDSEGHWVDGSEYRSQKSEVRSRKPDIFDSDPQLLNSNFSGVLQWREQPWWVSQRRLSPSNSLTPSIPKPESPRERQEWKYPALVMTAAIPLEPLQMSLRNLAIALTGTSTGLWLLASFVGRWVCRRALLPVTRMATAARTMGADDLDQRLPSAATGDELEDLAGAFNGLLDRLHESFERQRRFTGEASHQLRTPLTAMLGQIEVSLRRNRSADEYQRVLTLVQGQALNLRQIVEALLFLSRADAEAKLPNLEAIDLEQWLPNHLQTWSGHSREADLHWEYGSDGPSWVKAQKPLLGLLVDNLIDNACKYSKPGTPITLRLGKGQGVVSLDVEDQGNGIGLDDLPHVFEPFYRSSEARRLGVSGVGLGLAVAQRIAAAFDARITVKSEPGRGSCFTLRWPQTSEKVAKLAV